MFKSGHRSELFHLPSSWGAGNPLLRRAVRHHSDGGFYIWQWQMRDYAGANDRYLTICVVAIVVAHAWAIAFSMSQSGISLTPIRILYFWEGAKPEATIALIASSFGMPGAGWRFERSWIASPFARRMGDLVRQELHELGDRGARQ